MISIIIGGTGGTLFSCGVAWFAGILSPELAALYAITCFGASAIGSFIGRKLAAKER